MQNKNYETLVQELDSKIPRDVISERDGGGGRKLSYLEGWYVIDRLNKVVGQGNWSYETEEMRLVREGTIKDKYGNDVHTAHYIAKVTLNARLSPGVEDRSLYSGWSTFSDYGYGDGSDKNNPGKAHELAVKEAVTDAVKRCAKNLGMSLGLALYDKTQENVAEAEEAKPVDKNSASGGDAKTIIKTVVQVLNAKKSITIAGFKEKYLAPLGASKVDDLSITQAQDVLSRVKTDYRELQLN